MKTAKEAEPLADLLRQRVQEIQKSIDHYRDTHGVTEEWQRKQALADDLKKCSGAFDDMLSVHIKILHDVSKAYEEGKKEPLEKWYKLYSEFFPK